MSYIRTFTTVQHMNSNKEIVVRNILSVYRSLCTQIANNQWKLFFQTSSFNKQDHSITELDSLLSQRYRQTAQYQVVSILQSYISNLDNSFKEHVYRSSLTEEQRHHLNFINKYHAYYRKEVLFHKEPLPEEELKLSRYIMRHLFRKNKKPSFKHINMNLDEKVAVLRENDGTSCFNYWIRLSTLESGHPVSLPLTTHDFFNNTPGELKKFCQINLTKDNKIQVNLIKECPELPYSPRTEKIGIDFGLRVLFATDQGDLLGRNIIDVLRYYDNKLLEIVKYQDKLGFSVKTKKYNSIVKYIQDLLKQEICRAINRIIKIHAPKEIVVEKLDFSDTDLSKQINRILRNCGRKWVELKLTQVEQELGIKISKENPAYSSQVCTKCGYVDKNNRPSQGEFRCKCCGYTLNADVKSAREHLMRSSYQGKDEKHPYSVYKSKQSILYFIVHKFFENMSGDVEKTGCYSTSRVMTLLCENKYYEGWCSRLEDKKLMKSGVRDSVQAQGLRRKKKRSKRAKVLG